MSPRGSWARVQSVLLAVLAVTVMAAAVRVSEDRPDFAVVTGQLGQPVAVNGGVLSAGNVRVGTRLTRDGAVASETEGMFVVVEVRLAVVGNRTLTISRPQLLTRDGFEYATYDASSVRAASGFAVVGDFVFEVDPAHIDDLTAQLGETELVAGYQQRSRIHLGITPDNAEQWRAAAQNRGVEPRRIPVTEALT